MIWIRKLIPGPLKPRSPGFFFPAKRRAFLPGDGTCRFAGGLHSQPSVTSLKLGILFDYREARGFKLNLRPLLFASRGQESDRTRVNEFTEERSDPRTQSVLLFAQKTPPVL